MIDALHDQTLLRIQGEKLRLDDIEKGGVKTGRVFRQEMAALNSELHSTVSFGSTFARMKNCLYEQCRHVQDQDDRTPLH